jgi:hypothetical protein
MICQEADEIPPASGTAYGRPTTKETYHLKDETFETIFAPRGISREVAEVRHKEYRQGNMADVDAADRKYETLGGQRSFVTSIVGQYPGIVMVRCPVPVAGVELEPIFAELRPTLPKGIDGVEVREEPHIHPFEPGEQTFKRGWREAVEDWTEHLNPDKASERKEHRRTHAATHAAGKEWHSHTHLAKYVFPPSPLIEKIVDRWTKRVVAMRIVGVRRPVVDDFLRVRPKGRPDTALAVELGEKVARRLVPKGRLVVRKVKDKDQSRAKRLDMHPWAAERLVDAEVVYMVLEGCLKQDGDPVGDPGDRRTRNGVRRAVGNALVGARAGPVRGAEPAREDGVRRDRLRLARNGGGTRAGSHLSGLPPDGLVVH